jgi:type IV pilus assembly protein PilC
MSNYAYVAVDPQGAETRGMLDVADQSEALRRIREMGLFPTKVSAAERRRTPVGSRSKAAPAGRSLGLSRPLFAGRVKPTQLAVFTRQLATLVEAGMPLLRSLRVLGEQQECRTLKRIIGDLSLSVENGNSLTESVAAYPKVFNRLYVNMVRAGEIGGALEATLQRLAEFMEKAQKIKGKVKAAMFYPAAVLTVAIAIVTVLMVFVLPRFKLVFEGSLNMPLPVFTRFVFGLSDLVAHRFVWVAIAVVATGLLFALGLRTTWGRWSFDRFKLIMPVLGPLFRKLAISRFARTLGTLVSNGVPILQALTIVKETAGNLVVGRLIGVVHENVKQGEPIAPTLKASGVFPAMVAGMVDVGEQTGALPEMLMKIADNYDDEVDNAASAMTSLLEPIMIVFLAVVVGSIVVAMFLPLIVLVEGGGIDPSSARRGEE